MIDLKRWSERPTISLLMAAAGAVLGLALAGASLFSTRAASTWAVPPEDAAIVNGRPVLQSDYTAQTEQQLGMPFLKATPQQRHQILDDMIREELFVQRGLELDELAVDAPTRAAMVLAVQQQIAVDAAAQVPSEATLRKFYDDHRAKYESVGEMTLRDLIPAPGKTPDMAAAAQALKAGQPIAQVMASYGLADSGKVDGTELYFAVELHIGKPLYRVALGLSDGQSAGPILDGATPHILVMAHNKPPVPESFADAHDSVFTDYKEAIQQSLRDSEYKYLRARSDVRVAAQNR